MCLPYFYFPIIKFANFNDYRCEYYVTYNKDNKRRSTDDKDDVVPVFLNPEELVLAVAVT